jgi:hypothetical protein
MHFLATQQIPGNISVRYAEDIGKAGAKYFFKRRTDFGLGISLKFN